MGEEYDQPEAAQTHAESNQDRDVCLSRGGHHPESMRQPETLCSHRLLSLLRDVVVHLHHALSDDRSAIVLTATDEQHLARSHEITHRSPCIGEARDAIALQVQAELDEGHLLALLPATLDGGCTRLDDGAADDHVRVLGQFLDLLLGIDVLPDQRSVLTEQTTRLKRDAKQLELGLRTINRIPLAARAEAIERSDLQELLARSLVDLAVLARRALLKVVEARIG